MAGRLAALAASTRRRSRAVGRAVGRGGSALASRGRRYGRAAGQHGYRAGRHIAKKGSRGARQWYQQAEQRHAARAQARNQERAAARTMQVAPQAVPIAQQPIQAFQSGVPAQSAEWQQGESLQLTTDAAPVLHQGGNNIGFDGQTSTGYQLEASDAPPILEDDNYPGDEHYDPDWGAADPDFDGDDFDQLQGAAYPRVVEIEETRLVRHDLHTGNSLTVPLATSGAARVVQTDTQPPPSHARVVGHTVLKPEGRSIKERTLRSRHRSASRKHPYLRGWERR